MAFVADDRLVVYGGSIHDQFVLADGTAVTRSAPKHFSCLVSYHDVDFQSELTYFSLRDYSTSGGIGIMEGIKHMDNQ